MYIKEIEETSPRTISSGVMSNGYSVNTFAGRSSSDDSVDEGLSFTQIRIRYVIDAKFEIE